MIGSSSHLSHLKADKPGVNEGIYSPLAELPPFVCMIHVLQTILALLSYRG
jgi:hypothetical protein